MDYQKIAIIKTALESVDIINKYHENNDMIADTAFDIIQHCTQELKEALGIKSIAAVSQQPVQKQIQFGPKTADVKEIIKETPKETKTVKTENKGEIKDSKLNVVHNTTKTEKPLESPKNSLKTDSKPVVDAETNISSKTQSNIENKEMTFDEAKDNIYTIIKEYVKAKGITNIQFVPREVKEAWCNRISTTFPKDHALTAAHKTARKTRMKFVIEVLHSQIQENAKARLESLKNLNIKGETAKTETKVAEVKEVKQQETKKEEVKQIPVQQAHVEISEKISEKSGELTLNSFKDVSTPMTSFAEVVLVPYHELLNKAKESKSYTEVSKMLGEIKEVITFRVKNGDKELLKFFGSQVSNNKLNKYIGSLIQNFRKNSQKKAM